MEAPEAVKKKEKPIKYDTVVKIERRLRSNLKEKYNPRDAG